MSKIRLSISVILKIVFFLTPIFQPLIIFAQQNRLENLNRFAGCISIFMQARLIPVSENIHS